MKNLKILTFNWHESYIHLLAKTGYQFDVVERWKGGRFGWIREFRPVPPNCRLISEDEADSKLRSGLYDRVIAHNLNDILFVHEFSIPKVLVFHNKASCEIALGGNTVEKEHYIRQVYQLINAIENLTVVYISKAKKDDWGFDGEVILPGIDISEYGGYRGDIPEVLRVGNGLKRRDIMLGYSIQEKILNGLPSTILGLNPDLSNSCIPDGWDKLKELMSSYRVYLNTTLAPYEDGYNLALLEAMATGMPVVSIANPTSPIEDGVSGFVSDDIVYLRSKVEELLGNQALADTLGKRARETVISRFPIDRFISDWRRVLGDAAYKDKHYDLTISSTTEEEGMKEVLSKHTYDHRVQEMVEILSTFIDEKKKESAVTYLDAKDRDYFRQERKDIETLIPEGVMRILDVGCGEGILGKRLLEKGIREVIGIEINPDACKKAECNLSQVICGDVDVMEFPFEEEYFDCIIFADLLEHLRDPLSAVKRFKKYLSDSGVIVASIPNVRYYGVINMLTEGYWKYEDYGILDRTHLRFFTKKEMEKLFADAGFEITGISANIDPRYYTLDPLLQDISFGRVTLRNLTPDELKDLFVIQYLIRARKAGCEARKLGDIVNTALKSGNLEEAMAWLEDYLRVHLCDTEMLLKYADVCRKLRRLDRAIESIDRVLLFEPENKDALELRKEIEGYQSFERSSDAS